MSLQVSRILHAGYLLECKGTRIAFDPIFENPFSRNCYAYPPVEWNFDQIRGLALDAVFISHFHDDHCSLESLNYLNRQIPIYIYCLFDELLDWIRQLGFKSVVPLRLDQPVRVGAFEITPRRALDAEVDSLFQVRAAELNLLNVVDSWMDEETLKTLVSEGPWDMVLWPFQTMRELEVLAPSLAEPAPTQLPQEWAEQLQALNPRYVVPSSCQFVQEPWSWYNHAFFPISYQFFQNEIEALLPEAKIVRLDPSVSVKLSKETLEKAEPLSWVKPVGEQNVDYEYIEDLVPPSTAEIARHFPPLSDLQEKQVSEYCEEGLLEKFRSLDPPLSDYFDQARLWKLTVHSDRGAAQTFYFRICKDQIESLALPEGPVEWATEVPAAKLYAALNFGESLTSMYVRIHDENYAEALKAQIREVDLVEDPLIRCLFNREFGSYQAAQLKRILGG